MKKTKKIIAFLAVVLVACTLCTALVACNHKPDPETRPFSISISTPDGVFNPFFSTSAYDSEVIGMTQIGMMSTDKNGVIICGEGEPSVAKDYNVIESEKLGADGNPETTTYEFLIKKGIKWSDGTDLTILDVLFNLYVYLDPAYTGSATIYSTDIVGLQNYRMQVKDTGSGSDESASAFEQRFMAEASKRIDDLITYVKVKGVYTGIDKPTMDDLSSSFDKTEVEPLTDIANIAKEFYNELTSDWNAINVTDYKDWEGFDAKWKIFFLNDGGMSWLLKRENGELVRLPDKDQNGNIVYDEDGNIKYSDNFVIDAEAAQAEYDSLIKEELEKLNLKESDENYQDKLDEALRNICVNAIFENYFPSFPKSLFKEDDFKLETYKEDIVGCVAKIPAGDFETVVSYWNTANVIYDNFRADQKSKFFAELNKNGQKEVSNISGITTKKVTTFTNIDGKTYDLGSEYDVLSIKINGVDPKAIYNFSFTVSPMHYYSGVFNGKNFIDAAKADYEQYGAEDTQYLRSEFGVEFGNINFMNKVINAQSKIRLPMGAGAYMASTENGGRATSGAQFFNNNMIYYERNPYFETVGAELSNAKIKLVRYKVIASESLLGALTGKGVDFGEPGAIQDNVNAVNNAGLKSAPIITNGYGYVGINPRFVPDINVRRAIIKAMDTSIIFRNYYQGDLASSLTYPVSKANWVYKEWEDAAEHGDYEYNPDAVYEIDGVRYEYDEIGDEIEALVIAAGYTKNGNGVYSRRIGGFGKEDTLDYKFTIAGGSTDHPAYSMFLNAARILNSHGFNVKVVTSTTALTDLSAGKLEVWAAAWSSAIDPDMYQTYHMESQASSVKNWGYSQIIGKSDTEAYADEYEIIERLSKQIDAGRNTTDRAKRAEIYMGAFNTIMEFAVEFPIYQRKDLYVWQNGLLDPSTIPSESDRTPFNSILSRIWEVDYAK
ncbi:MAG: hypothetical protein K2M36_00460 [Clostridia bacterium]|nr:hypothetical protein [Clostridia bacterium]